MGKSSKKGIGSTIKETKLPPVISPEAREKQLGKLALDEMERRIINHEATGQELIFLAKEVLTSSVLEKDLKVHQKNMLDAKTDNLKLNKTNQELTLKALQALKSYRMDDQIDDED